MLIDRQQALISVIVPVYNMREYLARCVNSILAQTFPEMQILLVDDGSTDGSALLCDQFAEQDERITVLHIPHAGPGAARNAGIREAAGQRTSVPGVQESPLHELLDRLLRRVLASGYGAALCDAVVRAALSSGAAGGHAPLISAVSDSDEGLLQRISGCGRDLL